MTVLGIYEDEPILKKNQDFSTMIDEFIDKDNLQLVQVFSERIQKVKDIKFEKATETMMCVLF